MNTNYFYTATEMFQSIFKDIYLNGEEVPTRCGKTKHLTNVTLVLLNPYNNIILNPVRNLSLRYLFGELMWYFSGSNKTSEIAKYSKFWNNITDDGVTANSAYGYRIQHMFGFDQFEYCYEKLSKNKYDRQAVLHIKDPTNKPSLDTPCTCLIQFTVYNNKLNAHTYMRSNDIWLGLPYDIPYFTSLQIMMAKRLGLKVGKYYHTVGDIHLYDKYWNKPILQNFKSALPEWEFNIIKYSLKDMKNIADNNAEPMHGDDLVHKLWEVNKNARKI